LITVESIEALKARLDIVDVVGSYLELKKSGGGTFKACCPFHTEKTASFTVSAGKQIYHCFGCKAGGDAIKFVQEYERLSYPETLEKLAGIYGVRLEYEGGNTKPSYGVFKKINDFFASELAHNETAKEYLVKRGVSLGMIEKFELGYAPASKAQVEFARAHLINFGELVEAGIFGQEGPSFFARFVERVTFPIKNASGVIIGFGGRTLTNHPAKYVNSPQTKYFNKSKVFFALEQAKEEAIKRGKLVIVEGYMDALMLHQYGFTNAVAVLGTALTKEHIPTIKKLRCDVVLGFDADSAGLNAATKSSLVLLEHGIGGGVAVFDKGLDPADMLTGGKEAEVERIFAHLRPFGRFLIDGLALKYALNDPVQKQSAFDEVQEILKVMPAVVQDEYKNYASVVLSVGRSLFKNLKTKRELTNTTVVVFDLSEASIIKTIIEKPSLADTLLDLVSTAVFTKHRDILECALAGESSHGLSELLLDENIETLDAEHFVGDLGKLAAIYLERAKMSIKNDTALALAKKSFWLRRINELVKDLKSGKSVIIDAELDAVIAANLAQESTYNYYPM
jgi:DNA primase